MATTKSEPAPFLTIPEAAAFLTIPEAAAVLRIGRTAAYELARRYLATGGREGLPVVRLGRMLRVPGYALAHLADLPPIGESDGPGLNGKTSR